ncbi:MaoC/PaaZ C-terminal domain-containing protein [Actinomadura bangladeshensis]|uniref:MaoC/PaaZ C-terminal domain-containing protein n=1 Tax=Actinomadura bangladeshensis TaxID=453573 RepID=UPI0014042FA3|nr:MaoC/PaaZ C-terminal domain-containing protein [Actinomadura bangladeshensis]
MSEDGRLRAEDLPLGRVIELGDHHVTREEIISFATQWDPQSFHVDEVFARETVFGDVIGSGLHTMAVFQRLAVAGAYRHWAVVAGRAIREVSLTSPLRPDTTVHATLTVDSVVPHSEQRALVSKTGRVMDGDGLLMTIHVDSYVLRRA